MNSTAISHDSILVVDDTPVNLKLVSALLSKKGFQVRTAATAEEALQLAQKFHPRLILADIQLPGMDGLELTRRLKADPATRETLVVALTAFATENDEQEVLEAGCDGYMTKPIDARTFPEVIRQYITTGSVRPKSMPQLRPQTNEGFSSEEFRQSCLSAGLAESWRVMELLEEGFRRAAALAAHRWVGLGGSLGYPEIRQLARELETVLEHETPASSAQARNILTQLARVFAQKMGQDRCALPAGLPGMQSSPSPSSVETLMNVSALPSPIGKRFALIGFPQQQAELLSSAAQRVGAVPQILADFAPALELDAPDLVVLNVTRQMEKIPSFQAPCLLIGPQDILLRLQPAIASRTVDYLFSPWTTDEAILRCCFTLLKANQAESAIPVDSTQELRVLIVDQDFTVTALVQSAMRNWGFCCRVAQNITEALEIVPAWAPHAVLMDLNLLDANDSETLTSLRNELARNQTKIMLLATDEQESDVVEGFQLGAADYIIKPFTPADLQARLKKLLQRES